MVLDRWAVCVCVCVCVREREGMSRCVCVYTLLLNQDTEWFLQSNTLHMHRHLATLFNSVYCNAVLAPRVGVNECEALMVLNVAVAKCSSDETVM